ncbi:hypothetical protein ACFQZE_04405 [Paenibacillus sp. GCM10027627]|uniref:hypothetical protein n=1 Tax=unclassified Paenibacillus TaxID=185978 RepID=UPI003629B1C2
MRQRKKQRKLWMVLGGALFFFALGYLGLNAQSSQMPEQVELGDQQAKSHQHDSKNAQPQQNNKLDSKESQSMELESLDGEGITVIGDSVIIGVEPYLKEHLPKITVDGKVSKQMSQAENVIAELEKLGKVGDTIIIQLGTNGSFNKKQLYNLLESLSDKQVFVVNVRVPKGWQDTVNENIKDVVSEFDNAKVVDWYTASEGKKEYFYNDGVHLNSEGAQYYASLLIEALKEE